MLYLHLFIYKVKYLVKRQIAKHLTLYYMYMSIYELNNIMYSKYRKREYRIIIKNEVR